MLVGAALGSLGFGPGLCLVLSLSRHEIHPLPLQVRLPLLLPDLREPHAQLLSGEVVWVGVDDPLELLVELDDECSTPRICLGVLRTGLRVGQFFTQRWVFFHPGPRMHERGHRLGLIRLLDALPVLDVGSPDQFVCHRHSFFLGVGFFAQPGQRARVLVPYFRQGCRSCAARWGRS